jgi:pimeloyl-ACP methyl ester carboxylesterase
MIARTIRHFRTSKWERISNIDHFIFHNSNKKIFAREWKPIHVKDEQERVPIILLHDSLGCVELWRDFPARLSSQSARRVIAYDRLGFGLSDSRMDAIPLSFIQDEAEYILPRILEHFNMEKFIIFGHSVGGGMAIHCAHRFPRQCAGLITESAQTFLEDRTIQGILDAKKSFGGVKQFQRLTKYHGDKAQWVLDSWTESWLHPTFAQWSLETVLKDIHCPVLAVHGENDEFGSVKHPKMIENLVKSPYRSINILENCGHVPHREKPEIVLQAVCSFLDDFP